MNEVIPAQKCLLKRLDYPITADCRYRLHRVSEIFESVSTKNVPADCRTLLVMYVAICFALTKEFEREAENYANFNLWWINHHYPHLLNLYGQALLVCGRMIEDSNGDIQFSLDYLAKQVAFDFGMNETSLRSRKP